MYMTGSSPGPTPDIPDSVLGNIRDAMRSKMVMRDSRSPTPPESNEIKKSNAWLTNGPVEVHTF
jgi:hypothetical protein